MTLKEFLDKFEAEVINGEIVAVEISATDDDPGKPATDPDAFGRDREDKPEAARKLSDAFGELVVADRDLIKAVKFFKALGLPMTDERVFAPLARKVAKRAEIAKKFADACHALHGDKWRGTGLAVLVVELFSAAKLADATGYSVE